MKTEYITSGKFYYKVVDGKKIRISEAEYVKNTASKKTLKRGGTNDVEWYIIFGKNGNLSPSVQEHLKSKNFSEVLYNTSLTKEGLKNKYIIFPSTPYDLSTLAGIQKAKDDITHIVKISNNDLKGAILFLSAQRDPNVFEYCKNEQNFNDAKLKGTLDENRSKLWNLNFKAPLDIYDTIAASPHITFGYISSIYVYTGKTKNIKRLEVINKTGAADFIEVDTSIDSNTVNADFFESHGKELYAYSKRYVELKLYEKTIITTQPFTGTRIAAKPSVAKIAVLRMDGITSDIVTSKSKPSDSTFLKTLADTQKEKGFDVVNFGENRFPVFSSQVAKVLVAAVNNLDNVGLIENNLKNRRKLDEANITVFHVAGTEKGKGVSKGQIIAEAIKNMVIATDPYFTANRLMDDSNSMFIAPDYAGTEKFYDKLFTIYTNIKNNKTGGAKKPL
jgi:hypothetical protein